MTKHVVQRGNKVFFSFTFYDEDDVLASVDSATVQLTYPGLYDFETVALTLVEGDADAWAVSWDSANARGTSSQGIWVEYHAHAIAGTDEFAEDGRFRLTANRANLDHDEIPTPSTASSSSAMGYTPGGLDYGE